jgi:RNA polymerase sigma-70 factor (ECF subfamily)
MVDHALPAASLARAEAVSDEDCERLRRELERAVGRVCPPSLRADADDIVQDALIRVLAIARSREGKSELRSSYLWRVAYTVTIDEIRRRRRRREVPIADAGAERVADAAPGPFGTRAGGEIGEALQDCLRRLLASRRQALVLYLQGHSVPEAARLLAATTKSVENLVFRGLADLRQCLRSKGLDR